MLRSMRFWLVGGFALVALLTVLALGSVLLISLTTYYQQLELNYLEENGTAISSLVSPGLQGAINQQDLSEFLNSLSFLSRVRIRLLDRNGNELVDAKAYQSPQVDVVLSGTSDQTFASSSSVFIVASNNTSTDQSLPSQTVAIQSGVFQIPVESNIFGFAIGQEYSSSDVESHSTLVVKKEIYSAYGELLGSVELSEGPAYGREIVANVEESLVIAGSVSFILALVLGWLYTRQLYQPIQQLTQITTTISNGDLTVRANTLSPIHELKTLSQSFNRMAERIQELVETLRRFAADAAHELQTPLTALRTNLELAIDEKQTEKRELFLKRAQIQVDRMALLSQDLLDLSRLESRTGAKNMQTVNAVTLIAGLAEPYAARAEQKGIGFRIECQADLPEISANPDQLQRAITNLLDNALKFGSSNGEIVVNVCQEKKEIVISVANQGDGIPNEELPRLFERFHRGRNAAELTGSGLGLAIVKEVAAQHGGHVDVKNLSKGEVEFRMFLPI